MKTKKAITGILVSLILATAGSVSAQEFRFLWSDAHDEVLAKHNAVLYTPTEQPLNYVDWRYSTIESQAALNRVYPRDRQVVTTLQVVPSDTTLAESDKKSTLNVNGEEITVDRW